MVNGLLLRAVVDVAALGVPSETLAVWADRADPFH